MCTLVGNFGYLPSVCTDKAHGCTKFSACSMLLVKTYLLWVCHIFLRHVMSTIIRAKRGYYLCSRRTFSPQLGLRGWRASSRCIWVGTGSRILEIDLRQWGSVLQIWKASEKKKECSFSLQLRQSSVFFCELTTLSSPLDFRFWASFFAGTVRRFLSWRRMPSREAARHSDSWAGCTFIMPHPVPSIGSSTWLRFH